MDQPTHRRILPIPKSNLLSEAPSSTPLITVDGEEQCAHALDALRSFVDPSELAVVFQPIIELATGKLYAYEALVRCSLPEFRQPPALFEMAVKAQCTGLLGRMIREIGVPLASGVPLFVNIHPGELSDGWLVRPDDPIFCHDELAYLEVTESVPLLHFELCKSVLDEVCGRGSVFPVVDDFGAGYSNIKYISDLNPKIVKIDRKLVTAIHEHPKQLKLVRALVDLCTELDAKVVVEGIETTAEYSALLETGAHYGQGFLFARPGFPLPEVRWPPRDEPEPKKRKERGTMRSG
ncbi:MAG: EAL domain-containing protein [Deltaproteobacteria bacterium]|jgi:EAL domain-containing protein (putative c-di-GMP-specific phosphodiesterase class I)|nr:EAL domain-containing protein [Deltaproteobacteria bacterium]MBW2534561.1 EAL domain-containing protein [Deltaproteobacteria bacterium]